MKRKLNEFNNNEQLIREFYKTNKTPFINYLLKRFEGLRYEDAEDLYQESVIALYQNIQSGKLVKLTSSLSTYLLTIGVNKTLDRYKLKENKLTVFLNDNSQEWTSHIKTEDSDYEHETIVYEIITQMESPCKELIFGFYYDKFSMNTLAAQLGYKDENVAKATKYKCMQKVRNAIMTRIKKQPKK